MKDNFVFNGRHLPYNPDLIERAQRLRRNPTLEEHKLWEGFLKDFSPRFRRQRVINHFIADFYCPQVKLVIEIDDLAHKVPDSQEYDEIRSATLLGYQLDVLRFDNSQVNSSFDEVCNKITQKVLLKLGKSPP